MEVDDKQIKIKAVYDKHTKERLDANEFHVKLFASPNQDSPIYRIFKGNDFVTKNNSLICEYECNNCQRLNVVSLNNISRKLNRKMLLNCHTCKEKEQKSDTLFIEQPSDLLDRLRDDEEQFDAMDDDFKRSYFRKHLTRDEFDHIKRKILSFQHDKFKFSEENFVYLPCVRSANRTHFNPYLYDVKRDVFEKIQYVHFKCDGCSKCFMNRDVYQQKNKLRVLCDDCGFTNKTVRICKQLNILGCCVQYQSKLEKKLIDWANGNSVVIENGPRLSGDLRIGFQLPRLHIIVDCHSNQDLKSGKWQAKASAAEMYVKDGSNEYTKFLMIFPKDFVEKTNYLNRLMTNKI
jgi:predicted RNA-binding Zn-ribbon protein involved in translation (DUF1610 family)